PTYLSLVIVGSQYLLAIRILRLLRVFRVFKLTNLLTQSNILVEALKASRAKIAVFLFAVLTSVVVIGAIIYVVEGPENGFTSIPVSMYWAIVTLTTVGYGDISPQTPLGQFIASIVMIMGYAIIAVPTGIVSVEIASATRKQITTQVCPNCLAEGHDKDASHCKYCGSKL
ncbi:MAG: ion transporter, partial [Ignavibacteriaceae bacterium]